jgi:orotate phosphoribosyltransferase
MEGMQNFDQIRNELLAVLKKKSVLYGDFILASGAKSNYYIDCRLTTLDAQGACLVGQCMHALIRREAAARKLNINAVGGLTMGADPIAVATAISSYLAKDAAPLGAFVVRKAAKTHGQGKLIEGNYKKGDTVVVIEDVVTGGDSAITAINAVKNEGGHIGFVAVLVDRQQGGRAKIEALGYPVVPVFTKDDLLA